MNKQFLTLGLFVCLTVILALGSEKSVAADLEIVNFSVRSGDAALVFLPTGKVMMIDSGKEDKFNDYVLPFLQRHSITHLDYYAESHPHGDHSEGADVMRTMGIIDDDTVQWDWKTFDYEEEFTLEGVDFFIYNVRDTDFYGTDANENSLAFTMTYNNFVYSTGGDEGTKSMQRFMDDHPDKVPAHIRKTAHHAYGPFDEDFLKMTDAYLYVVSNSSRIRDWNPWDKDFKNKLLPTMEWLAINGGRIDDPGYVITQEVGHIYIRASSGTDWEYSFLSDLDNDMIPNYTPPGSTPATPGTINHGFDE